MSTTSNKPTTAELDDAKRYYNDVNDYLEYLADIIQSQAQEYSEDSEDSDEELSPAVSQFLDDYKDYISSLPQVHTQLVGSKSSSTSSKTRHRLRRYSISQTHQLLPPDLLSDIQQLCEAKIDRSVQVSPSFSTSLPANANNEKLLTNETSPSVTLLKAQLEKYSKEQEEKNRIVIRMPKYTFDEPIEEERKIVFVVKKSTALIAAPPSVADPPKEQEPIKEEIEEKNSTTEDETVNEKVSSKKKKNMTDFAFLSNFLSITKVGFSRSQLSTLVWT